tara:strand:+ start:2534 stop:3211 length:678 start_codon:yes stop_codon:yes gene_type:complete
MKNISEFFESINPDFLSVDSKLEARYDKIWKDVYLPSQRKKIFENNISEDVKIQAFNGLSKRGKFLCDIYDYFKCKNIAEVGTAEGFQFFTFCDHIEQGKASGKVYTCDVRDVRSKKYSEKYQKTGLFTLGTSKEMSEKIIDDKEEIDLFWIDGAHHNSAVLTDVIRLSKNQSKDAIWIFDDFNKRFGSYQELQFLASLSENYLITLGPTASGKPNNMLIVAGRL